MPSCFTRRAMAAVSLVSLTYPVDSCTYQFLHREAGPPSCRKLSWLASLYSCMKHRFIHDQDPLYMLGIWVRMRILERQKFHGCRYTTSPVFPGILRIGLLSGRPNSTHLYTQTTRLNASQPRPLAQRRRGLAQVKPRILSDTWAA